MHVRSRGDAMAGTDKHEHDTSEGESHSNRRFGDVASASGLVECKDGPRAIERREEEDEACPRWVCVDICRVCEPKRENAKVASRACPRDGLMSGAAEPEGLLGWQALSSKRSGRARKCAKPGVCENRDGQQKEAEHRHIIGTEGVGDQSRGGRPKNPGYQAPVGR